MELNEQTVAAHFELMTKPQEYGLPFRPFEECFEPSETVTAQHILYRDYASEKPELLEGFLLHNFAGNLRSRASA